MMSGMTLEKRFQELRQSAADGFARHLSQGLRGANIGTVTNRLERVARELKVTMPRGWRRKARLLLASDVYKRPVGSYNDLTDGELGALGLWARRTTYEPEMTKWFKTALEDERLQEVS